MQAVACSNDDTLDVAFGTAQTSTDTLLTALDQHTGPTSSAITIAGSPAAEDLVVFQVYRNASSGSDTLAVDAKLLEAMTFRRILNETASSPIPDEWAALLDILDQQSRGADIALWKRAQESSSSTSKPSLRRSIRSASATST
jgi:hypothetical protein